MGPVPVKGLPEPIEVYELLRAGPVRSRLQAAAARGLTRFVGRGTELEQLTRPWHALQRDRVRWSRASASQASASPACSMSSPARTTPTAGCCWRATPCPMARPPPTCRSLTCSRAIVASTPGTTPAAVREKVTGKLLTLDRALEPTLPALLALLEVPVEDPQWQALDPPQRRRRTLEAVKRLLLRESQVQPLLLVFEDLHWIDTETQALLDSLVESLPTARLLLLVNYRPEYQHGWGSKTYYTQLRLDPLPPASADELLQALLGDDPSLAPLTAAPDRADRRQSLLSGGECAHPGRDGGPGGRARVPIAWRTRSTSLQVPATVQAVLAARIDRLPPEEKRLLQTAAVIGTEVPWPLLQAIADVPDEALHRGLAHLQAAEFLYETSLFPEHAYTFKHALTHEVAYGGLLHERRRLLHARIVEALEQRAADRLADQVERLAHHALRGEVWDKAVAYCRQAGDKAMARSAYREAVACFEQALVALAHLPEGRDAPRAGHRPPL